jgi:hypothetical protein
MVDYQVVKAQGNLSASALMRLHQCLKESPKLDKADASQHDLLKANCTCDTVRARHKPVTCKNRRPNYKDAQEASKPLKKRRKEKKTET